MFAKIPPGECQEIGDALQSLRHGLSLFAYNQPFFSGVEQRLWSDFYHALTLWVTEGQTNELKDWDVLAAYNKLEDCTTSDWAFLSGVSQDELLSEWALERVISRPHPFLRACEKESPEGISALLKRSYYRHVTALQSLVRPPWRQIVANCCKHSYDVGGNEDYPVEDCGVVREERYFQDLAELKAVLRKAPQWADHWQEIGTYVYRHGLPPFRGAKAFLIGGDSTQVQLEPMPAFDAFELDWLEGSPERVEVIMRNTVHFLRGRKAHNILIWGPRGGGKSSLVRGLIERYAADGLRGIEITPEDYGSLRAVCEIVRSRRERFIGVLDNISLGRGDRALHHLSRVMEGGLVAMPDNLVFYATSNFKDLVDREGERPQGLGMMQMESEGGAYIQQGKRPDPYDPQQHQRIDELRALDDRFALKVFVDLPTKNQYESMVLSYAKRAGIARPDQELLSEFAQWRMRHNHDLVGGRTARDFIRYLALDVGE